MLLNNYKHVIRISLYEQIMVHPDALQRPSAGALVQHKTLSPFGRKTKAQLCRELNEEKLKNELLARFDLQLIDIRTGYFSVRCRVLYNCASLGQLFTIL